MIECGIACISFMYQLDSLASPGKRVLIRDYLYQVGLCACLGGCLNC